MCSTPGRSRNVRASRRSSTICYTGKAYHRSYSDMLQTASVLYKERQKERNKRQEALLEQESDDTGNDTNTLTVKAS